MKRNSSRIHNICSCVSFLFFLLVVLVLMVGGRTEGVVYAATPICTDPALTISETACEALVDLHAATLGYQWHNDTNRLLSPDVNTWYGVEVTSGVVTGLDLDSNRLVGGLPAALGDLDALESLSMENNLISTIHPAISGAENLAYINLSWNNLTTIPTTMGELADVTDLYLEHNQLTSLPDIFSGLTNIELLHLQENDLSLLPESIADMTSLHIFDVSDNNLTSLPTRLGDMTSVHILDASSNQLTSLPSDIGDMTGLEKLSVQNNTFTQIPTSIGDLTNLYHLSTQNNLLTSLPASLTQATDLQYLNASENQITTLPVSFSSLGKLTTLYLNNNNLTELPGDVEDIASLRFLYLQENQIAGALPDSYAQLTDLHRIYLFGNALDRTIDPAYEIALSPLLTTWKNNLLAGGTQVLSANQDDTTAPALTSLSSLPSGWYATGVDLDLTREEYAYVENAAGEMLPLVVSGSSACDTLVLSHTGVTSHTGTITLRLSGTGVYDKCDLHLVDHAGQYSGPVSLEDIVIGSDRAAFCQLEIFTTTMHVPRTECEALVDLYEEMGGDTWTNNAERFHTPHIELWHGVRTSVIDGQEHVDGLFLHKSSPGDQDGFYSHRNGNNLTGPLSSSLTLLPQLAHVNMSKNELGLLPGFVGDMAGLTHLLLIDAGLNGTLPANIANANTLRVLNLQQNSLTGSLDVFQGMQALESLLLSNTDIVGALPISLTTNTALKDIRLAGTNISGGIPDALGGLTGLEVLDLGGTQITGGLPLSFTQLSNMDQLSLEYAFMDRSSTHTVIIPDTLTSWIAGITTVELGGQGDTISPVITSDTILPEVATGTMSYTMTIDENSYAVSLEGDGMEVAVGGSGACTGLEAASVMISSGTTTISLTPTLSGGYMNCTLSVHDHGGNNSNILLLPSFVYGIGNETVCRRSDLSVSFDECIALVEVYESLDGDSWLNQTNWLDAPDVGSWFGLTVENGHLTHIDMGGVHANNLSGTLPDVFGLLSGLRELHFADNALQGVLPPSLFTLPNIEVINLANNALGGELPNDVSGLSGLRYRNIGKNQFSGALPEWFGDIVSIEDIHMYENNFSGELPEARSGLNLLEHLNVSDNTLNGELPLSWSDLGSMEELMLRGNDLVGVLPNEWSSLDTLIKLDISGNKFVGTLPASRTSLTALDTLYIQENNFDRDVDPSHEARISTDSVGDIRWNALSTMQKNNQGDISSPELTSPTVLPPLITEPFVYALHYEENSYAVSSTGVGLTISFTGNALCSTLLTNTSNLTQMSGSAVITITPLIDGVYNCFLEITDHGGNTGSVYMGPFEVSTNCGNGVIDPGESCDEGRYCDDGTSCTSNPILCPTECRARLVDTCNPSCEAARCGDGYIDQNGIDNVAGNYDDETCDAGSYCEDGTDCARDPSICPGGSIFCQPRLIGDCNEFCTAGSCGDGTHDVNGEDNIIGTIDDEECDDANPYNGDGCSSTCTLEHCGDGFPDANGPDNIVATTDDEACDLGPANGLAGGLCSTTCELPDDECVFCYELCNGGTGNNSIFLLLDISGSMNNNNRLINAKQGASNFVDLVTAGAATNTGFQTKIGIIAFSDTSSILIPPTLSYTAVKTQINGLTAGGGTNFGDAIQDAIGYFETNDTSWGQHMILLSDGEPTVSGNPSFTPGEWAIYQANNAKARNIGLYTIAVDQTDEGLEYMSHISSSTRLNHAWNKPTDQESTYGYWSRYYGRIQYPSSRAVNAIKSGTEFSLTYENYQPRREVDLGENIHVEMVNVWNRTSRMHETADYWIHVSSSPFVSDDLTTILADSSIDSFYFTGAAERPSQHLLSSTGRYLRIQLTASNQYPESTSVNLGLSEVEVIGCPDDEICTSVYHYQDFGGTSIETIYGHIFGSIHCGCTPEKICGQCGDGVTEPLKGEECDDGSYCDNLTTVCTSDPSVCLGIGSGECRPRFINGCTDTCQDWYCGDGQINQVEEICDDGNNAQGDGCSDICTIETCGDGYIDTDGPDNIWGTTDDEACDDGNNEDGDGCGAACIYETCGDGYVDLDGVDNVLSTTGDNEQCDTGRSCNDGTDCTDNPTICPGECRVSFSGLCTSSCTAGTCGDAHVQSGSLIVGTGTIVLSEACDLGMFCEDNFTPCTNTPHFCSLLGIGGGTCAPRTIGACTPVCTINICGDGRVSSEEQCDDGNLIGGDGCDALCQSEFCGDGVIDANGLDNIRNTLDDEICDDGNLIAGDDCTSCKLDSCGNGILDPGEACDTINEQQCALPYCRLTWCGDGARQWPNGEETQGINSNGYEACDGTSGCLPNCKYPGSTTFCGDGNITTGGNDQGVIEVCDDGLENGQAGFCASDCLSTPTCGDGIVTDDEACDDGNIVDNDGCSSLCTLEVPLHVPGIFSGTCADIPLPVINPDEFLPLRWQLEIVDAVDVDASSCGDITSSSWILGSPMSCTFSMKQGGLYGPEDTGVDITSDCLTTMHTPGNMLGDALDDSLFGSPSIPILGSTLHEYIPNELLEKQQGQYYLVLDEVHYDYCVNVGSGVIEQRSASIGQEVCSLELGIASDYFVQDGAVFQEIQTSSLESFVDISGSTLFTLGTALDTKSITQKDAIYNGSEIDFLTTEFINTYASQAIEEHTGIWGSPIYKVPNERIYVYTDTETLELDVLELEQLVDNLSDPFTLIVEDADLIIEGSLGSLSSQTAGMFVVHGRIQFSSRNCDTTQTLQGIWIADGGFISSTTRNEDSTIGEWCSGGNIALQGMLIGSGVDVLKEQHRSILNAWSDEQVYVSYEASPVFKSSIGRKIFDICYLPALFAGDASALTDGGLICDHTTMDQFKETAIQQLSPYVQDWYQYVHGTTCTEPTSCTSSLPSFTCRYDDSDCIENMTISCNSHTYTCDVSADEVGYTITNHRVVGCEAQGQYDSCNLVEQECLVDEGSQTVTCTQRCSAGVELTCPSPYSIGRHTAVDDIITNGFTSPGTSIPPLFELKQAFISYDAIAERLAAEPFTLLISPVDVAWYANTSHKDEAEQEVEIRRSTLTDGASLYIEAAPRLWTDLPPGGSEMLESVKHLQK